MLHEVTRAILPAFSLGDTLAHWDEITADLSESPRRRLLQSQKWKKTS